ncbi:hypothetical protein [Parachitinimonas caeni]|uniref:SGNH/GDSL hydrolase family protein n=1 Tax=Parachitinimonas caeni TaxID=3031301 RepID=A0ABT7E145_9NEIS|nr:hypothetical protein [Parachitinimonas caeni]MDK2126030.1 hypothetical protein [Parachitinimonas caeni]
MTTKAHFLLLGDSHAGPIGLAAQDEGVAFSGGPLGAGREFTAHFFEPGDGDMVLRKPDADQRYRQFLSELAITRLADLPVPLVSTFGLSLHFYATRDNWPAYRLPDQQFAPGFLQSRLFDTIIAQMARDALAFYRLARTMGLRVLAVLPPQRVPALSDAEVFMAAQHCLHSKLTALGVEIIDVRKRVCDSQGLQRPEYCEADDPIHGNLAFGRQILAELMRRGVAVM